MNTKFCITNLRDYLALNFHLSEVKIVLCMRFQIPTHSWVNFINCFAPFAYLSRPAPYICASKKLLRSWAQGAKVGRKGAKPFMKSTPEQILFSGEVILGG